jgi:UDP-N-acetylmuramate--alanine ligase
MIKKEDLLQYLENKKDIDILVTFGAGDIDRLIVPIREMLAKRVNNG